jgi:hypothetical protein
MSVNKERMRLFVAGLRSGRFIQGRGSLKVRYSNGGERYCCLGVACEIAMEHGLVVAVSQSLNERTGTLHINFGGQGDSLPESVMHWYGLSDSDPLIDPAQGGISAITLNDNPDFAWTFEQIAAGFEQTYGLLEDDDASQ